MWQDFKVKTFKFVLLKQIRCCKYFARIDNEIKLLHTQQKFEFGFRLRPDDGVETRIEQRRRLHVTKITNKIFIL
jgi:hypothetical protein